MAGWGLHARPVQLCYSFLQTHHVLPTSRPSYMRLPLFSTHFSLRHQATFYSSIKFHSHATQSGEPSLLPQRRPSSSVGCTIAMLDHLCTFQSFLRIKSPVFIRALNQPAPGPLQPHLSFHCLPLLSSLRLYSPSFTSLNSSSSSRAQGLCTHLSSSLAFRLLCSGNSSPFRSQLYTGHSKVS